MIGGVSWLLVCERVGFGDWDGCAAKPLSTCTSPCRAHVKSSLVLGGDSCSARGVAERISSTDGGNVFEVNRAMWHGETLETFFVGVMLFRPPSHPAAMLKIIILTKVCRRDGASTPGDRHNPRRWPPNFAHMMLVAVPSGWCRFPDFYASASLLYHGECVSLASFLQTASRSQDADT